jgi:pyrroloquinoline quinone (PQQ) biosynthesis protein C
MLTTTSRKLMLRCDMSFFVDEERAAFDAVNETVHVDGVLPHIVARIVAEFDHPLTVTEVVERSGVPARFVAPICDELLSAGILISVDTKAVAQPSAVLVSACHRLYPEWKERLFARQLWRNLADGSASRNIVIGWLRECYHFIEGATLRLPVVIASTADPAIRSLFIKHFTEEFDHHHFFSKALASYHVDLDHLRVSTPLPTTSAVLNHMRESARRDPLCYATCSGFLESTGADRTKASQFLTQMHSHYSSDGGTIKPLIDHLKLDGDYEHNGMLERICACIDMLDSARIDTALEQAFLLVELLEQWSDDIIAYYKDTSEAPDLSAYRCRV